MYIFSESYYNYLFYELFYIVCVGLHKKLFEEQIYGFGIYPNSWVEHARVVRKG